MRIGPKLAAATLFVAFAICGAFAQTESRPWQQLQMPTAAQVSGIWNDPPAEYGPEPYYELRGPVTADVIRRDLDTIKALGWRAVTVQYAAGLGLDYMSPEYLTLFRKFVLEAKKRGLKV